MTRRRTAARALIALTSLTGVACLAAAPAAAMPDTAAPAPPTGIHVTKISSSSFTVAVHTAAHAKKYRVYVATTRKALAVANLGHDTVMSASKHPRITVKGLRYRISPYYYRVETLNGARRKFSLPAASIGLRPAMPTGLAATSNSHGTSLTWNSVNATGFTVEQATDAGMTQNVKKYRIIGQENQFTPYGLTDGSTYYFRVRSMNSGTPSAYAAPVTATVTTNEQPVSVMTYNVLEAADDGRSEGGSTVAPWSERGPVAASLIQQANPDVIGAQEAASWVGVPTPARQIDSLTAMLGGEYSLADTEIPPGQPHHLRTGVYILYKSDTYQAVGQGGHWDIGNTRWAAYQVLQNRSTGAKFLFVSAHLAFPAGAAADRQRETETNNLLSDAGREANGLPIVYVGDFNSDQWAGHAFNGPAIAMRAASVDDAYDVAQTRVHARYNTADGYRRTPPMNGGRIDYVFAQRGVAATSWDLVMDLSHGKFVGTIPSDHNPLVSNLLFPY
ncbi:MAG TPA: endonuclease/exonuclease/phosphatase family protein [Mycobacteriales bacterium]|nr:endonuclease/exonuclease/phosphatase family protein [Mycobacteriales bacterium]